MPLIASPLLTCRKEVAEILEQAERAARGWDVLYTHFHTPPVVQDALAAINQLGDITAVAWGGYPQAERCRIAMGREEVMIAAKDDPSQLTDAVAALDCRGNFMFDPATHRDFLGAILGTGVVRDRIGVSICGKASLRRSAATVGVNVFRYSSADLQECHQVASNKITLQCSPRSTLQAG